MNDTTPSKISRQANVTYSHTVNVIKELEKEKLVKKIQSKNRRERKITLTAKGEKIVTKLREINKILNHEVN